MRFWYRPKLSWRRRSSQYHKYVRYAARRLAEIPAYKRRSEAATRWCVAHAFATWAIEREKRFNEEAAARLWEQFLNEGLDRAAGGYNKEGD